MNHLMWTSIVIFFNRIATVEKVISQSRCFMSNPVNLVIISNYKYNYKQIMDHFCCESTYSKAPVMAATWARLHSSPVTFALSG